MDALAVKECPPDLRPDRRKKERGIGPRLLSVKDAAEYLGRSKASLQHMISSGALPIVRFDRRVFLDIRALDTWIDQNSSC